MSNHCGLAMLGSTTCPELALAPGVSAANSKETKMATRTQSRQGGKTSDRSGSDSSERSAFSWSGGGAGVIAGAALAGAAVGIAANVGRKLFVQMACGASGDWVDALKTEHRLALAIFDKILATD